MVSETQIQPVKILLAEDNPVDVMMTRAVHPGDPTNKATTLSNGSLRLAL